MLYVPDRPDRDPDLAMRIHGEAKGAGSKDVVPQVRFDKATERYVPITNKKGIPMFNVKDSADENGGIEWTETVAMTAASAKAKAGLAMLDGPLWCDLIFFWHRRKGHLSAKGGLLPSAPVFPASRPDRDKLARRVWDALTAVVYGDDGQIVGGETLKAFSEIGDGDYCEIRIWKLPEKIRDIHGDGVPEPAEQQTLLAA